MGVAAEPKTIIWGRGFASNTTCQDIDPQQLCLAGLGGCSNLPRCPPLSRSLGSPTSWSWACDPQRKMESSARSHSRSLTRYATRPSPPSDHRQFSPALSLSLSLSLSRASQWVPRVPATQMPDGQSHRIDTWSRPETPSVFWHVQGRPSAWCQLTPNLRRVRYLTHGQATATLSQHFA